MGETIAYIRVSTEDQKYDRQQALEEAADTTFKEKASAGTRQRPELERMLKYARAGDHITVLSIDRLARSTRDLLAILNELEAKKVSIAFERENLHFDWVKEDPRQTFTLTLFSAIAQLERSITKERQAEGIAKAKAKGVYRGRARAMTPAQALKAKELKDLDVPVAKIAKRFGVSRSTIYQELKNLSETAA